MYIVNILCSYKEYRRKGEKWVFYTENASTVDSIFIQNMVDASSYFTSMGGTQEINMKNNRRFGMQVSCITCISFCGGIRKEFVFNYNNAKCLS